MPFNRSGITETFSEARRIKLLLSLNDGEGPKGIIAIRNLLMELLHNAEVDGFHGAEIDMLMFKKEN